jgi:uncharacterized membrane protein YqjE
MTDLKRPPYPLDEPDKTLGDLFGRITHDVGVLFRDHIELAKEETKAELREASAGAGLIGGAALAGWMSALMLTLAAGWGLAEAFDNIWLGFSVVGLIWALVGTALWISGRNKMKQIDPTPRETMHELEEDRRWLKEQTS